MNKLYIIEEILYDYTPGMAVICASSLDRCREIFVEEFDWKSEVEEFDESIKQGMFKVIEDVNHAEGLVSYVCGGG
jgi:hypothetical protein